MYAWNKNGEQKTIPFEELVNPAGVPPLVGFSPVKMHIAFAYYKENQLIPFVPTDYKVMVRSWPGDDTTTDFHTAYIGVENDKIVVETPVWIWGVPDSQFVLYRNGKIVFDTVVVGT